MSEFIGYMWLTFWIVGIALLMLSNASLAIRKTNFERKSSWIHVMGYSIKEIREAIESTDDEETRKILRRKIAYRRIGLCLMIGTPILFMIQGVVAVIGK